MPASLGSGVRDSGVAGRLTRNEERFISLRKYETITGVGVSAMAERTQHWMVPIAALGDLAVFGAFVAVGGSEHGVGYGGAALRTALPFAAVRFVLGAWLGAFRVSTMTSVRVTAWKIPLIFLVCGVIAVVLRAWLFDRGFQLIFALVAVGAQVVMLLWWRAALALGGRRLFGSR